MPPRDTNDELTPVIYGTVLDFRCGKARGLEQLQGLPSKIAVADPINLCEGPFSKGPLDFAGVPDRLAFLKQLQGILS